MGKHKENIITHQMQMIHLIRPSRLRGTRMKILLTGGDGMLGTILRKYWKGIHEVINLDKVRGNDLLNCDS